MLITTKQRRHHIQNARLNITINELNLQQVNQQKVIGVVVDENLKWREHVNGVYKKISQTIALFRRIKQFLPPMVENTILQLVHHASLRLLRDCLW